MPVHSSVRSKIFAATRATPFPSPISASKGRGINEIVPGTLDLCSRTNDFDPSTSDFDSRTNDFDRCTSHFARCTSDLCPCTNEIAPSTNDLYPRQNDFGLGINGFASYINDSSPRPKAGFRRKSLKSPGKPLKSGGGRAIAPGHCPVASPSQSISPGWHPRRQARSAYWLT